MMQKIKIISFHLAGLFLGIFLGKNINPNLTCSKDIENYSMTRMAMPYRAIEQTLFDRIFCVILSPVFITSLFLLSLGIGIIILIKQKIKNAKKSS
ncbi:MAG: hypothetical protein WC694_03535 [Candidatus Paceibacterota bacterium]|jgi:hypothetical protein